MCQTLSNLLIIFTKIEGYVSIDNPSSEQQWWLEEDLVTQSIG